jgi:hypothetical protein
MCRFTHSGLYLVHVKISKTPYNSERREYNSWVIKFTSFSVIKFTSFLIFTENSRDL